jgi:DNA-binding CsgD family transcriptional regulator
MNGASCPAALRHGAPRPLRPLPGAGIIIFFTTRRDLPYIRLVSGAGERVHVSSFQLGGVDFVVLSAPMLRASKVVLTKAERQIAALVSEGFTNAQIAKRRKTSIHTVANQMAVLFRKTGVGSRVELAVLFSAQR